MFITAQVQTVIDRHRGIYGAPRVHQELRAAGLKVGSHRVARLMRCSALKAKTRRGFRPCRNNGSKASGVAENLLQQDFSPLASNHCWAGDITYIRTTAGWRYLAVWIDLNSRRVVGWSNGATMEATLVLEALNRALSHRQIEPDQLLIHTDQGGQILSAHQVATACHMGYGFVMQQGIEPIAAQLLLQLPVPRAMFSSRWLFSYQWRMRLRAVGVAMKLSQSRLGCAVLAVIADPRVNAARKGASSKAAMPLQLIQPRRNAQAVQGPQNTNKNDESRCRPRALALAFGFTVFPLLWLASPS